MSTAPATRVLLVENDYLVADFSKGMLNELGYDVLCVPSRTAISVINNEPFDLALLDIEPKDTLVEPVASRLQKFGIPIVLLADHPRFVPPTLADHAILLKPFHWTELQSALKTLIKG